MSKETKLNFIKTRDYKEFKPIIAPLIKDFTEIFNDTILEWCGESDSSINNPKRKLWEIWLVKINDKSIGVCGLYVLDTSKNNKEVWLGWFGIIPELRNQGLGRNIMEFLYSEARKIGASAIYSYVDKDGAPLSFYKREGFNIVGTVKEYNLKNKQVNLQEFEDINDIVITKKLI